MKYIYDSHLGGIYVSDEELDYKARYCEHCRDSDQLLGTFETLTEFWNIIKDNCSIDGSGGYSLQHIFPIIVETFPQYPFKLTYEFYYQNEEGYCSNTDKDIIQQVTRYVPS